MKRLLFYVFLVAGIVATVLATIKGLGPQAGTEQRRGGGGRGPGSIPVEVAPIKQTDLVEEGNFTGSLIPRSQFTVMPKVGGRLKKIMFEIGDPIRSGQVVAELEDDEFVQGVAQAEAETAIARANLRESEALLEIGNREFDRVSAMRQQKVSSVADFEAAQAQLKSKQARHEVNKALLAQKETALKTNRLRLSFTKIDVLWADPVSVRYVGERFQDVGAMVSPNTPILSIVDLATLTAVLDLIERDYFKVKVGQTVEVTSAAAPGRTFQGMVARISPVLNASTRQARLEIGIPNPESALKPGMFVTAKIQYATHSSANTVPATALARRNGLEGIFLVDPESRKARYVPVQVGLLIGDLAEIASPTITGQVVTLGHHLLEDGSAVLLPGEAGIASPAARKGGKGKERNVESPRRGREGGAGSKDSPGGSAGEGGTPKDSPGDSPTDQVPAPPQDIHREAPPERGDGR